MSDYNTSVNKHYYISLHSFVDLITNSSSEIFISANKASVQALAKVIDAVLVAGGSTKRASDLFLFTLGAEVNGPDCETVFLESNSKELADYQNLWEKYGPDGAYDGADGDAGEAAEDYDYLSEPRFYIRIIPLHPDLKDAATILNTLPQLFSIEERSNY